MDIDFSMETSNMTCNCSSSKVSLYAPAGHVITGNLDIVKNTELRNLIHFKKKIIFTGNLIEIFALRQLENIRLCGPEEKILIFMSLMNGNIQLGIILKIKSKH